jgi:hypothetical protein
MLADPREGFVLGGELGAPLVSVVEVAAEEPEAGKIGGKEAWFPWVRRGKRSGNVLFTLPYRGVPAGATHSWWRNRPFKLWSREGRFTILFQRWLLNQSTEGLLRSLATFTCDLQSKPASERLLSSSPFDAKQAAVSPHKHDRP